MIKRRSREELIEAILTRAREPEATVISVMQGLDWNTWNTLKKQLAYQDMIIMVEGHWQTTAKGLDWLSKRKEMKAIV